MTLSVLLSQLQASSFLKESANEEIMLGSEIPVDQELNNVITEAISRKMRNLSSGSVTTLDDWIGVEFAIQSAES